MSLWKRIFGKKEQVTSTPTPDQPAAAPPAPSDLSSDRPTKPLQQSAESGSRRVRVFISSTFRDMREERDILMTHTWPEMRRYCRERQVELVEVDLRWGIAEEQSTRKETLKLCLDEIRACRPFFIGLLGERYGWMPGDEVFTADLKEEQPWIKELHGKSVTELEILHGVLRNPEMAGRSFFYFRDPAYAQSRGEDFLPEDPASADRQTALKGLVRATCDEKNIPLRENYPDSRTLASLVLEDLKAAIDAQFPIGDIPDPLQREANDHESFAEIRRRTYIGRSDYFKTLDDHASSDDGPLVLLGDSGSGKSALLANWIAHWKNEHTKDFIFQHYIGGTTDSAEHWRLMTRLVAEIKRWSGETEELPKTHDDLLRDFPLWLSKARIKAEREGVRFIVVLDALNQLEDHDHARLLGWLPSHPFSGPLRLIVSTLPGDTLRAVEERGWRSLRVQPLTPGERGKMITHYLARFGKKLDKSWLERLGAVPAAANPLYLKIVLDELRVTGTHEGIDERLYDYLAAPDIPALLRKVLTRYECTYEQDRKGLVSEALGLIWAARRGLTETELLSLLRPANLQQLPPAIWAPLRAALEEGLVDRGGILNFAHNFLRTAVEAAFVPDKDQQDTYRLQLADDFWEQPVSARTCDELPWLLWQTESSVRLRVCLLNIDRFLLIRERDQEELMRYWIWLGEERNMGNTYLDSLESWSESGLEEKTLSYAANELAYFLNTAALYVEAEQLYRRALAIREQIYGENHTNVAQSLSNLAVLLQATNRLAEAEPLMRRTLAIDEWSCGKDHPHMATDLSNLAALLESTNRLAEAEPLMRRALAIDEQAYGKDHPSVSVQLNILAGLLRETNRSSDAERLYRRALAIDEHSYGKDHPEVAIDLNNLALLLLGTKRFAEAEPLIRRALAIDEQSYGKDHPRVATNLSNLALLFLGTKRFAEAEPLMRRALAIDEQSYGKDHPRVAIDLFNLAILYRDKGEHGKAEPLYRLLITTFEQRGKAEKRIQPQLISILAGCHNNIAFHTDVPTKNWKDVEYHYHQAIDLFNIIPHKLEALNVELNLQNLFWLSGRKVDLESVREITKALDDAGDPRAQKGHKLIEHITKSKK